jgi:hypothetical protein
MTNANNALQFSQQLIITTDMMTAFSSELPPMDVQNTACVLSVTYCRFGVMAGSYKAKVALPLYESVQEVEV